MLSALFATIYPVDNFCKIPISMLTNKLRYLAAMVYPVDNLPGAAR